MISHDWKAALSQLMIAQGWKTAVSTFLHVQEKGARSGGESGSIRWSEMGREGRAKSHLKPKGQMLLLSLF